MAVILLSCSVIVPAARAADGGSCDSNAASEPIGARTKEWMQQVADVGLRQYQLDYTSRLAVRRPPGLAAPRGGEEFCRQSRDIQSFQARVRDPGNRLSFINPARGFFNGGLCWWHSRFTRNAAYLAYYNPSAPRLTPAQAEMLIHWIASGVGPLEIPGYRNLHEFSSEHEEAIIRRLERWQAVESTAGFAWVRGASGSTELRPSKFASQMDELYDLVENRKQVVYQKLQIPGAAAHAWLVTGMKPTSTGYELEVHDSNSAEILSVPYERTDKKIRGSDFDFVPYTSFQSEIDSLSAQVAAGCNPEAARRILAESARKEASSLRQSGKAGVAQAERYDGIARSLEAGGPVEEIARSHPAWLLGRAGVTPSSWSKLFD